MKSTPATTATTAVLLLALATALTACTAPEEEIPPLNLESILDTTTQFQAQILEDGKVTASEYEMALLAERDCVITAGAVAGELYETGNAEKTFDYEVTASDESDLKAIDEKAGACLGEYFDDVAHVWAYQQLLTAEERKELQPKVVQCLTDTGIAVPSDADLEKITEILYSNETYPDLARPCIDAYPGFFFIAPDSNGTGHSHE
ncbi:hypothetical protein BOH66_01200 [Microbacterium aurum]|uniref:Lipoprotein n=1 Tax=Microbacterium aurum TaxID=36805 RepID=A0A1P8U4M7_9MICO|nr:hypothetical protein [Microbacterium aurum]APZ33067.1 hypothetical protein BOH66_01200 [Microbacterium aurum]MBM7826625.1 hypothetical protein [Microbacterium aurum]